MNKNWIGLLCAVFALSACGKSLRVTQKPGAGLNNAGSNVDQGGKQQGDQPPPPANAPLATQKLIPISIADAKEISGKKLELPFVSGEEKVDYRTIGSPTGKSSTGVDFVKSNTVVFRALIHVPKADQVEKVNSLTLTLQNWSLVTPKGSTAPENTVLCLIGGETTKKSCFGKVKLEAAPVKADAAEGSEVLSEGTQFETAQAEPTDVQADPASPASAPIEIKAAQVNAEFFKDLKVAEGVETKMEDSGEISETQDKVKVRKTAEIDLLKTFGIKPEDAMKWINDNSVDFDGKGTRKVRLVMGDQLYAASGSLILNVTVKKGAPAEEAIGAPSVQDDEKPIAAIPAATLKSSENPAPNPDVTGAMKEESVTSNGAIPVGAAKYDKKRQARIKAIGEAIQNIKTQNSVAIESVLAEGSVQQNEVKVKGELDKALKDFNPSVTISKSSAPSTLTVTVKLKGSAENVAKAKTDLEKALKDAFAKNS
jgi:hypothetical protein